MKYLKLIALTILLYTLSSCQSGVQKGSAISRNHINYIRSLGLLDANERIILFDSQYKIRVSGNFFTDKRIAAYWTDERDTSKSHVNNAFYPDIDSIKTHYVKKSNDVSYLEVFKSGGKKFRVYVNSYNLLTFTGLKNYDPEHQGPNPRDNGDFGKALGGYTYPMNRTFNLGANVSF